MSKTLLVTCICITSSIINGQGAVSAITDPTAPGGIDNITFDSGTNLEWLDWDISANISYDSIITMFGSGGAFEGWRHATRNEVNTLFTNLSLDVSNWPAQTTVLDSGASGQAGLNMIGQTTAFAGYSVSTGMVSDPVTASNQFTAEILASSSETITRSTSGINRATASTSFGHALVRSVPEPSHFILLGLGSLGILHRRKRS